MTITLLGAEPASVTWGGGVRLKRKNLDGPKLEKKKKLGVNFYLFIYFFGRTLGLRGPGPPTGSQLEMS
jgi:hypothetical protein